MRLGLTLMLVVVAGCSTTQSRHAVETGPLTSRADATVEGRVLDDFSDDDAHKNWTLYTVRGSINPLTHKVKHGSLEVISDSSAGLLWRDLAFDPQREPLVRWRWRVSRTFDTSTPLAPEFDNFPARLLVGFNADWDNAGPLALTWRRKVEKATGETPPARAICYTFGGKFENNEAVDAAFGEGRIVVINLRTPRAETGRWYDEIRDVASDYASIFGEPAPPVMAVGLGCDSHRLKTTVSAMFDDLTVYPTSARAQFKARLPDPPQRRVPLLVWIILSICGVVATGSAGAWLWMRHEPKPRPRGWGG